MELVALAYEWTLVSRWLLFIIRDGEVRVHSSASLFRFMRVIGYLQTLNGYENYDKISCVSSFGSRKLHCLDFK